MFKLSRYNFTRNSKCRNCGLDSSLTRIQKTPWQRVFNLFFAINHYSCDECRFKGPYLVSRIPRFSAVVLALLLVVLFFPRVETTVDGVEASSAEQKSNTDLDQSPVSAVTEAKVVDREEVAEDVTMQAFIAKLQSELTTLGSASGTGQSDQDLVTAKQAPEEVVIHVTTKREVTIVSEEISDQNPEVVLTQSYLGSSSLRKVNGADTILAMNPNFYTIQVSSSSSIRAAEGLIDSLVSQNDLAHPFFVYLSPAQSTKWYPVLYGYFESSDEAEKIKHSLPNRLRRKKPLVRRFLTIQRIIRNG